MEFVEKVKGRGGHAEIVLYPGQAHGFFNPRSTTDSDEYFDRRTQEMVRFIANHG